MTGNHLKVTNPRHDRNREWDWTRVAPFFWPLKLVKHEGCCLEAAQFGPFVAKSNSKRLYFFKHPTVQNCKHVFNIKLIGFAVNMHGFWNVCKKRNKIDGFEMQADLSGQFCLVLASSGGGTSNVSKFSGIATSFS